jgi:N-acyl-L-homoserine lactone synthetase
MSASTVEAPDSFVDRVDRLLQRVDYRRADSTEERLAIFRLRYAAYMREGAIAPRLSEEFSDPFDDNENAWIFGVYVDGKLASSIRLNITLPDSIAFPTLDVFPDILRGDVLAGKCFVDPTRFVADRAASRLYPELPYVTVRLPWMASEYFKADVLLAAVRSEHQAFYKRLLGHQAVCAPRPYPSLQKPISLMTLDYGAARERVQRRYPFFRSTYFERRMLFERGLDLAQRSAA